jgi:predicted Zn-dependent protease
MWLVGEGDLLLVGTNGASILPRLDNIARRWRRGTASEALTGVGIDDPHAAFDLLSLFVGGPRELERYGEGAIIQTDDHSPLEYSAPRGIYGRTIVDNAAAIRRLNGALPASVRDVVEKATDEAWTSRGTMLLKADAYAFAYEAFRRAVVLNSRNRTALAGMSDAAAGARKQEEERESLRSIAAREPANAAVRIELSRVLAAGGDFDAAIAAASEALQLAPDDPSTAEQLASILADAGDADRLASIADALLARFPSRRDARYYRAAALFLRGKTEDAIAEVRQVVGADPRHARAQNLLGAACATLGRRDCAQAAFEASLRANPRDPSTYVNLGRFSLQAANPRAAADYFAEALLLDPTSAQARSGLAQARSALGANPE